MNTAYDTSTLVSLYDHDDEISGVRLIPRDQVVLIFAETSDDPGPVYALATSEQRREVRRYYVGVRFVEGIIPSTEWEAKMADDGVSATAIVETWRLLSEQAL